MIVADFIKWLETQDQDATVKVLQREADRHGDTITIIDFDPENSDHWEYTDMRGNPYAKGESWEGDRTLLLGNND